VHKKATMDPLAPSAPRTYPTFCTSCHGRYQCVCAILEDLGFCPTCRKYNCECVGRKWDYLPACTKCEERYVCVCDFLIAEGHCPTCLWLDCDGHPPQEKKEKQPISICSICESPYYCVCQLLIECGNCPRCLRYANHCICEKKVVTEMPVREVVIEELPCGCFYECSCLEESEEEDY